MARFLCFLNDAIGKSPVVPPGGHHQAAQPLESINISMGTGDTRCTENVFGRETR
jgi:hypothetical protein